MATIKIRRSSEYINKMRAIKILVDGKEIGSIANGEAKDFTLTKGQHKIEAKIDWCGSSALSFDINDTETKTFKIESYAQKNKFLNSIYLVLAIAMLHFILVETIDFYYTGFLLLPSFIYMVYHITFGRKKYLTLNEMDYGI